MKTKSVKPCAAKKTATKKTTQKCDAKKCTAKKTVLPTATFTYHAEKGKAVYLAGDFNDWNPSAKKMAFKDGVYSATVRMSAGEHQYKFVIDGAWSADPENTNSVPNDQGTYNSVVVVK